MTYLNALEGELTAAGIPAVRRRRILAEFADHLHEDPGAQLGSPRELARQFADELGTRLARAAAFRAFAALAFAGVSLVAMFVAVGGNRGLGLIHHHHAATPTWTMPILLLAAVASQVALAAGVLALLRAWRLRDQRVISAADATVLARRSAVGLLGGLLTLAALPACAIAFPHAAGHTWTVVAWIVAGAGVAGLGATAPALISSFRLRPTRAGEAADLIADLGGWVPRALTPTRCALLLALGIAALLSAQGVIVDDPYDGAARGIVDAIACLGGFAVLGRYLGLRTTTREAAQ
ncbi:MAG TPA: hypothetical protein VG293_06230 [Solirubrobacteraceae bacterium]|jgi:hypothetical protein|nr:hypothetical protein [Solirubrobacteraceae bacterium]